MSDTEQMISSILFITEGDFTTADKREALRKLLVKEARSERERTQRLADSEASYGYEKH